MAKIQITQTKSSIKYSTRHQRTIAALGLKKINQSVEKEATPQILGMIEKVRHLVKVTNL